jgi:DUF1365 family protein
VGLNSAIYEGTVRHRRFAELEHEFTYRLFMVYLDLAEIPEVMSLHPLWSTRPRSPACLRRSDYLGPSHVPLDRCVRDQVFTRTGRRPSGPIRMLSNLRYFGLIENPITLYYCFDSGGTRLETVLAEVTNTPWGDRHSYVIAGGNSRGSVVSSRLEKAMHVSPLMDMDHTYELSFGKPGCSLPVHIESEKDGKKAFEATLRLSRTEISRSSLGQTLVSYPPMSYRATFGIYTQAAFTWLKGARYHGRPGPCKTVGEEALRVAVGDTGSVDQAVCPV